VPKSSSAKLTPQRLECQHLLDHFLHVVHQQAFGQFQLESARGSAPLSLSSSPNTSLTKSLCWNCWALTFTASVRAGEFDCALAHVGQSAHKAASSTQRPRPQDQARFLGEGDEFRRDRSNHARDVASAPGLRRRQPGPSAFNLGLVVQNELPFGLDGAPQVGFHRGTRRHRRLHFRIEKAHRIAPRGLGLIHRRIGALHQFFGTYRLAVEHRYADAATALVAASM
jgi:hypothetical protein